MQLHEHAGRDGTRALARMMDPHGVGAVPDFPSERPETLAPIDLFNVHEVAFIETSGARDGGSTNGHERAEHRITFKCRGVDCARIPTVQS